MQEEHSTFKRFRCVVDNCSAAFTKRADLAEHARDAHKEGLQPGARPPERLEEESEVSSESPSTDPDEEADQPPAEEGTNANKSQKSPKLGA